MKRSKLLNVPSVALIATGVFFGRGAQADTILDFDALPNGVGVNDVVAQTFGDAASASSDGVTVAGFGTPNIGLTWQSTGGAWDHYTESGGGAIWTAVQLDSSDVGDRHELVFTPNNPAASVVIKSFNLHGYYISNERFTYDVSILAGATVVSGPTNISFLSDATKDHPVSLSYTGAVGQALTLRLARVASTLGVGEEEGDPYDIAVDDITFAQLPQSTLNAGPQVISVTPVNESLAPPDYYYVARLDDGITGLKASTVRLRLNGTLVSHTLTSGGGTHLVSYQTTGLLPPGSTNTYRLTYGDNDNPPNDFTNEVRFVVVNYVNQILPAPIVFQDFNATAEGSLPAGWTRSNLDTVRDPASEAGINYTNLDSGAYTNWTVVEVNRFTNLFETYSQGAATPPGEASDYQRVLTLNPSNVVNGVFLRNFASGRFAFGNTGYRLDVLGQVMYLTSPDFNLTGRTNVHVAFHSLWEQNQDSIAAVEYSVDLGVTWQPALYLLHRPDIATNLDGSINSLATFTNIDASGAAEFVSGGVTNGGYYGAFIGVASNLWGTLAPYISGRVDDNPVESKRVEVVRLALADNQPNVRLRFLTAGKNSWYWGIDNLGLYSLPVVPSFRISSIVASGTNVVITWPGEATVRLQRSISLTTPSWQDLPGTLGASSATVPRTNSANFFRLSKP